MLQPIPHAPCQDRGLSMMGDRNRPPMETLTAFCHCCLYLSQWHRGQREGPPQEPNARCSSNGTFANTLLKPLPSGKPSTHGMQSSPDCMGAGGGSSIARPSESSTCWLASSSARQSSENAPDSDALSCERHGLSLLLSDSESVMAIAARKSDATGTRHPWQFERVDELCDRKSKSIGEKISIRAAQTPWKGSARGTNSNPWVRRRASQIATYGSASYATSNLWVRRTAQTPESIPSQTILAP